MCLWWWLLLDTVRAVPTKQNLLSLLAKRKHLFLTMGVSIKSKIKYNEENEVFGLEKSSRANWMKLGMNNEYVDRA